MEYSLIRPRKSDSRSLLSARKFLKSFMTRLKVSVMRLKPLNLKFSHNIQIPSIGISLLDLLSDLVTLALITDLVTLHTETVLIVAAVRDSRGRVSWVTPRPLRSIISRLPRSPEVTPVDLTPGEVMVPLVTAPHLPGASHSPRPGPTPGNIATLAYLRRGQGDLDPGNPGPE